MSGTDMKKPKITKETLFVTRRRGKPNGYGRTPKASFDDQVSRMQAVADGNWLQRVAAERHKLVERYKANDECATKAVEELNKEIDALKAAAQPTWDNLENWLIMAMAYHQRTNALEALHLMEKHPTPEELFAAKRVQKHMDNWIKKLGPVPTKLTPCQPPHATH